MMDLDNTARDFKELDAREVQTALEEELSSENDVTKSVEEEAAQEDVVADDASPAEDKSDATSEDTPPATTKVEWSEEDITAHMRMAEALLFAAAEPLDAKSLADRLPEGADIEVIIQRLEAAYEPRGVNLRKVDKSWRFMTAPDVAPILDKERVTPRKLSRAAMETLAIIAYHQPCTRADIEDVRGVQVAKGSLDQLLEIGWVRLAGKRRDTPGRPTLYRTTQSFLEQFSLETVQDPPGLADLKAAGLLDARLPPGFSVPSPADGDDEDDGEELEEGEFAQDFLADEGDIEPEEENLDA